MVSYDDIMNHNNNNKKDGTTMQSDLERLVDLDMLSKGYDPAYEEDIEEYWRWELGE